MPSLCAQTPGKKTCEAIRSLWLRGGAAGRGSGGERPGAHHGAIGGGFGVGGVSGEGVRRRPAGVTAGRTAPERPAARAGQQASVEASLVQEGGGSGTCWRCKRPEYGVHRGGSYGGRRRMPVLTRGVRGRSFYSLLEAVGCSLHTKAKRSSRGRGVGSGAATTCVGAGQVRRRDHWLRGAAGTRGTRGLGEQGGAVQVGGVHGAWTDGPKPASACGPNAVAARRRQRRRGRARSGAPESKPFQPACLDRGFSPKF
jgi:hypothetical protein